ncbi:uncharacterized protein LOC135643746 [Musa acuminata AAA Group]|uniref:uncharacterized protein LOC135643746 n=1 Tax=Musa acuminata AAA Group TaxID=214697 RepID=UPI0031D66D3A
MDLSHLPRSLSKLAKRFRSKEKSSSSPDPSSPVKEGKRGREEEGETSGWRRAKSKGGRDEDEVSNVDDRSSAKIRPSPSKKKGATRGSDGEKPERAAAGEGQEKRTSSGRKTEMVHSPSPAPEVTPTKTETSGSARKELEMAREGEEEKGAKSKGDDESIMSLPSEKPIPPNEDILAGKKLSPTTPVTSGAEVSQRQGEGGVDMNGGENAATRPSRSPLSSSTSGPGGSNNKESKSIGVKDEEGGHEGGEKKLGMMSSPPSESDKEEIERMREEQEQGDKRSYSELAPTTMISSSPLPTIGNEEMRARSGVEVSERQGGGEDMNGGRSAVITSSPSPSLVSTSVQGGSNNELERIRTGDERARHESGEQMMETTLAKRDILESDKKEKERTREEQEQRGERSYSEDLSSTTTISSSPMTTVANEEMRARSGVEVSERQGGGEDMNDGRSAVTTSSPSPSLVSTSVQGGSNNELERIRTGDERARHESGEQMMETTLTKREILESDKKEERTREEQEQRGERSYSEDLSSTTTISSSPMTTVANEEMRARSGVEVSEGQGGGEDMNDGRSAVTTSSPSPSLVSTSVQGGSNNELERIRTGDERARHESGEQMMETTLAKREILESDKEEEEERTREEQEKGGGTNYSEELSPTTTISSSPLPTVANEEMRARSGVEVSERQGGEGEAMYGVRSTEITSPLSPSLLSTSVSVGGNYKEPKSIQTREEQGEDESEEKNVGMTSSHPMTETTSTKTEILETAEEDSKGTREEQGQRSKRSHPIKDSPTSSSWSMPMSVNGKTELGDQKWSPTTRPTIANEDVTATEPKRSHESFVGGGNDEEPESINARGGQGEYMNGKKKMEMVPIPSPILETTPSKRKVSGNEEIESTMEGQVEGDETSNQERRDDDRNVPSTSFMFESVKEETRVEKPKRKEEERQRGAYNGWKAGLAFGIIAVVGTITWIGSTLFLKRRQSNVQSQRPRQP